MRNVVKSYDAVVESSLLILIVELQLILRNLLLIKIIELILISVD